MGDEIFFEIFLQKSVNFVPLNLRIVRGYFKLCQISRDFEYTESSIRPYEFSKNFYGGYL